MSLTSNLSTVITNVTASSEQFDQELFELYMGDDAMSLVRVSNSTDELEDYDYEVDFTAYDYWDLIPTAIVYGITLLIGLVGEWPSATAGNVPSSIDQFILNVIHIIMTPTRPFVPPRITE